MTRTSSDHRIASAPPSSTTRSGGSDTCIIGSPYCVRRYVVDERFGGPDGLAKARAALEDRNVRLVLDYVPNHVAPDHPWVTEHPERFITGTADDAAADPAAWTTIGASVLAH